MRKESSTNTLNKKNLEAECGMAYAMAVLSGRWKLSILAFLIDGKLRYGELKKKLRGISERMLIAQLKELQADGLILRKAYPEVPPKVEYQLSEKGYTLKRILRELDSWGEQYKNG